MYLDSEVELIVACLFVDASGGDDNVVYWKFEQILNLLNHIPWQAEKAIHY